MNHDINELHQEAMKYAEMAFAETKCGNHALALEHFQLAFDYEVKAANLVVPNTDFEPTRSVLLRSAASLALKCNKHREAEKLVSLALAGNPPEEIADELRILMEEAAFLRHLDLRGIRLEPNEVQLAVWGGIDIGYGIAKYKTFIQRLDLFTKLIYRTIERIRNVPFRESGSVSKELLRDYELFMAVPTHGSFCVTLRIGSQAPMLPGFHDAGEIVEEVIDCLDLVNTDKMSELAVKIPDNKYRENLVSLTHHLAPDGKSIENVRISAPTGDTSKSIILRSRSVVHTEKKKPGSEKAEEKIVVFTGLLQQADSRVSAHRKWGKVTLVGQDKEERNLRVPMGMMADIVRPYYECLVEATVVVRRKTLTLKEIAEVIE